MTEEYLDVLDENGNLTGKSLPRSEVHKKGLLHRVVHVWIATSKGEVVLQKRAACKESFPNLWDISAAGHVKAGSTSMQTAREELHEELGLDLPEKEFNKIGTVKVNFVTNNGTYINNEYADVYVVHKDVDVDSLTLQVEEVSGAKLMKIANLKKCYQDKDPSLVPCQNPQYFNTLFGYLESIPK